MAKRARDTSIQSRICQCDRGRLCKLCEGGMRYEYTGRVSPKRAPAPVTPPQLVAVRALVVEVLTDGGMSHTGAQRHANVSAVALASALSPTARRALVALYETAHADASDWLRFCCGEVDDDIEPMRRKYRIPFADMALIDTHVWSV